MTRRLLALVVAAMGAWLVSANAQTPSPFKLGTFELAGKPFVGIVVKDSVVIDLAQADTALKSPASNVAAPADMKDLIARYDSGLRGRILAILQNTKPLEGAGRPAYVHDLKTLRTRPPIMYPTTMLNSP